MKGPHSYFALLPLLLLFACTSKPEIVVSESGSIIPNAMRDGGPPDDDKDIGGFNFNMDAGPMPDAAGPCEDACSREEHCEQYADGGDQCVPNDCAGLDCGVQACITNSKGAYCSDTCSQDSECLPDRFCDTDSKQCEADVCTPGEMRCQGEDVLVCVDNGSELRHLVTCGENQTAFDSVCSASDDGLAGCTCEDDWDCPAYQTCAGGVCVGSGVAPKCVVEPEPLTDGLSNLETQWGGASPTDRAAKNGAGTASPFPGSAQVLSTPVVANLDDDNDDGLINDLDYPEIIFVTFCDSTDITANGVLRAIHGGGPDRGADYFANCSGKHWVEGLAPNALACDCASNEADVDSSAAVAVGDLDFDGVPEIVALIETGNDATNEFARTTSRLRIYDHTGRSLTQSAVFTTGAASAGQNPAPSLANVLVTDEDFVEIIVGRNVFLLGHDNSGKLIIADHLQGDQEQGANAGYGPVACVAELTADNDGLEIVAGGTVYGVPTPPAGVQTRADCDVSATDDFCLGQLVLLDDSTLEGFCAIADVWGADSAAPGPDNPLDGVPEVVVVSDGTLYVLADDADTPGFQLIELTSVDLQGGGGGPPTVADFDADGLPEVGVAYELGYRVTDFQAPTTECPAWTSADDPVDSSKERTVPDVSCSQDSDCSDAQAGTACNEILGECVCLHNGWLRSAQDATSQVSGSSAHDFNGDGSAEILYNDECHLRMYSGSDGAELARTASESRTRIENPIVADVDNDSNAELVFSTSNESNACTSGAVPSGCNTNDDCSVGHICNTDLNQCEAELRNEHNNGIEVWGNLTDRWVAARRVYNQHGYHGTNVTESGRVPLEEPAGWLSFGGRSYNGYRSQPAMDLSAPDLWISDVRLSSPDQVCGMLSDTLTIAVEVTNAGDAPVGPGVGIVFEGTWDDADVTETLESAPGVPLRYDLTSPLGPGQSRSVQVQYSASDNTQAQLPDRLHVVLDPATQNQPRGAERECDEDNNDYDLKVGPGSANPDLALRLHSLTPVCPSPKVTAAVENRGSLPAQDILVYIYLGDPKAGGTYIAEAVIVGPIAPSQDDFVQIELEGFPPDREIRLYGVVDPFNLIAECNEANNVSLPTPKLSCDG